MLSIAKPLNSVNFTLNTMSYVPFSKKRVLNTDKRDAVLTLLTNLNASLRSNNRDGRQPYTDPKPSSVHVVDCTSWCQCRNCTRMWHHYDRFSYLCISIFVPVSWLIHQNVTSALFSVYLLESFSSRTATFSTGQVKLSAHSLAAQCHVTLTYLCCLTCAPLRNDHIGPPRMLSNGQY